MTHARVLIYVINKGLRVRGAVEGCESGGRVRVLGFFYHRIEAQGGGQPPSECFSYKILGET